MKGRTIPKITTGMWVTLRNNKSYFAIENAKTEAYGVVDFALFGNDGFCISSDYNSDLKSRSNKIFDIMTIKASTLNGSLDGATLNQSKCNYILFKRSEKIVEINGVKYLEDEIKELIYNSDIDPVE